MNITFAKHTTLVASETDPASFVTDPVDLGSNDRASAIPVVHYFHGPNSPRLIYSTEVSNDGVNWVSQGPSDNIALSATGPQTQRVAAVNGRFVRVELQFTVSGVGGDSGAVCFDLVAQLDRTK